MRLLYKTGPMESLRKWFYKPKRDDCSLLAQFFFADDALNLVAAELDSFDGRKDPERCSTLVNHLRHAQDRVLNITSQIMDQLLGSERVARGFRVKFPEDVLQDNLAGQLWFGAECLAAGSSIMNREEESAAMRPLARALTRSLETVRALLRERCLRPAPALVAAHHDEMLHESLKIFDRLFSEFELCYVSAMVPVKSAQEFEVQQLICVLFSETLHRALKMGLLTQDQVDDYDPAVMFAIPRLAIVSGLLIFSNGPLSIDKAADQMSDMFRPFRTLLHKIRELLWTLERRELLTLEKLLCTNEDIADISTLELPDKALQCSVSDMCHYPDIGEFVARFYADHSHCKELLGEWTPAQDLNVTSDHSNGPDHITDSDYLPDDLQVFTPILEGMRRLSQINQSDIKNFQPTHSTTKSDSDTSRCTFQQTSEDSTDCSINTVEEVKSILSRNSSRKVSRNEDCESPISNMRNLSSTGLSMFDPLHQEIHSTGAMMPDHDLVSSLNEQVTEIADKLSQIVTCDDVCNLQDRQLHSYSTNDVSILTSDDPKYMSSEDFRNDSTIVSSTLSSIPSTSHGYLIPNAISQEPVVMASLSHNNSAVFNEEDLAVPAINIATSHTLIIPENLDGDIMNTSISIANANLSSLLLTNEEFQDRFMIGEDNTQSTNDSFHSARNEPYGESDSVGNLRASAERVQFVVGYDSDTGDIVSPGDSGVCTENTSLDRSPDSDQSRLVAHLDGDKLSTSDNLLIDDCRHYMNRNRLLISNRSNTSLTADKDQTSKFTTEEHVTTVDINYIDDSDLSSHKNEASSSNSRIDIQHGVNIDDLRTNVRDSELSSEQTATILCSKQDNSDTIVDREESACRRCCERTIDSSPTVTSNSDVNESYVTNISTECELPSSSAVIVIDNSDVQNSRSNVRCKVSDANTRSKKSKMIKSSPKNKKKRPSSSSRPRIWSPGKVILENRSHVERISPMKLNLDYFVDDGSGVGSCSSVSSLTSSFHSDCADDEEIALALQAQELAARQQTRAKFKSSEDLIHRLFVCIAGVADQLQTNYAADLRNILKSVFLMNQTPDKPEEEEEEDHSIVEKENSEGAREKREQSLEYEASEAQVVIQNGDSFDSVYSAEEVYADNTSEENDRRNSQSPETHSSRTGAKLVRRNTVNVAALQKDRRHNELIASENVQQPTTSRQYSSVQDENVTSSEQNPLTDDVFIPETSINRNANEILRCTRQLSDGNVAATLGFQNDHNDMSRPNGTSNFGFEHETDTSRRGVENRRSNLGIENSAFDRHTRSVHYLDAVNRRQVSVSDEDLRERGSSARSMSVNSIGSGVGCVPERAPEWVPDVAAPDCMRCSAHFTAFRRRHHCRNCGKVFCASCSSNSVPLPRFGQHKPVRVCEECFYNLARQSRRARARATEQR